MSPTIYIYTRARVNYCFVCMIRLLFICKQKKNIETITILKSEYVNKTYTLTKVGISISCLFWFSFISGYTTGKLWNMNNADEKWNKFQEIIAPYK